MPSWRYHDTAIGTAFLLAMSEDAHEGSLPLIHPADSNKRLDTVFSSISYFKGKVSPLFEIKAHCTEKKILISGAQATR